VINVVAGRNGRQVTCGRGGVSTTTIFERLS